MPLDATPEPAANPGVPEPIPKIDRKLLDEIFGDVLPDVTSDERDPSGSGGGHDERWYRENMPPHHG